eukprot:scaffold5.g830.t1
MATPEKPAGEPRLATTPSGKTYQLVERSGQDLTALEVKGARDGDGPLLCCAASGDADKVPQAAGHKGGPRIATTASGKHYQLIERSGEDLQALAVEALVSRSCCRHERQLPFGASLIIICSVRSVSTLHMLRLGGAGGGRGQRRQEAAFNPSSPGLAQLLLQTFSIASNCSDSAAMYHEEEQPAMTAFRMAEKRYQLHKDQVIKMKKGRRRCAGYETRPVDLSELLDVDAAPTPPGAEAAALGGVPSALPPCAAAFLFPAHPGLLLVRNALDAEQQRRLVVEALTVFPEPPAHTNHTRRLGALPGLFQASRDGLRLRAPAGGLTGRGASRADRRSGDRGEAGGGDGEQRAEGDRHGGSSSSSSSDGRDIGDHVAPWAADGAGPPALALLRTLRWATLGPPFDWTARTYLRHEPHRPLPPWLLQLAESLAALAWRLATPAAAGAAGLPLQQGEQGPHGDEQQQQQERPRFDSALVNYYHEGDTLGGHKDDAERDLQQPIVALSMGCPGVFLIGSDTRDTPPTALFLRSGDVVVLAGASRACLHGVPRIFTGGAPAPALVPRGEGDPFAPFAEHMRGCRINVSIRDTR